MPEFYCNYAESLGALEGTPEEVWGTPKYDWRKHLYEPVVFFGMYDARQYFSLWRHRGKKYVLWAGSDIRNLSEGFAFNDGKLRKLSVLTRGRFHNFIWRVLGTAEHWVENEVEKQALEKLGIEVTGVCPSFMGDVDDFRVAFEPSDRPNVYVSCSGDRQLEYGFGVVERIAHSLPKHVFHLYGGEWETKQRNVKVHGRVLKCRMNEEIRGYQIGLRLNEFDGFSEIMAKAVLQGQYAVGRVEHPKIPSYRNDMELIATLHVLGKEDEPNPARDWYRENLNAYPWNTKKQ